MRNSYRIDADDRIVYVTWATANNYRDWTKGIKVAFADPAFETGFNVLSDRRAEAASATPSTEDIKEFARFIIDHKDRFGSCKIATVVSNTSNYGMARMLSLLAEKTNIQWEVFTDYEEALDWLRH